MPRYIVKLGEGANEWYLEWSTVVDAPVTFGMDRDAFARYYEQEYGRAGIRNEFQERMERVDAHGTSSRGGESARDLMIANRAGPNETEITYEEIIETYCRQRGGDRMEDGDA